MDRRVSSQGGQCCCAVCVRTQGMCAFCRRILNHSESNPSHSCYLSFFWSITEVAVVEDLGQFKKLLDPGFHCLCFPIANVVGRLSLRIQQLDVLCETKTKDNVFVQVAVAVQYRVLAEGAYDAFYRLTDPRGQIQSYVFDVVRS